MSALMGTFNNFVCLNVFFSYSETDAIVIFVKIVNIKFAGL